MKKILFASLALVLSMNINSVAHAEEYSLKRKQEIEQKYEARKKARREANYKRWLEVRKTYDPNSNVAKNFDAWIMAGLADGGYGMTAEATENLRKIEEDIGKRLNRHLDGYSDVHDFQAYVAKVSKHICAENQQPDVDNCIKEAMTEEEFYQALDKGSKELNKIRDEAEGKKGTNTPTGKAAVEAWKKTLTKN